MVRIIIKGGVWKNTEDEVLKAAIAKYGKNQWARISSLLVRKTPKQCKARWYEWLDPSIKKTEWSKTEDEKLLHLAKLMPTQWRTIAPIVGRTATQCLERYQKLLDEAEAKENDELGLAGPEGPEGRPTADDIRRLRPGEIDPDPETKPARPDPIDMDEDEKEMLSEARARLANTQGKKAKRKARERQLEEARRLAVLQKKRELKAAGIIMRHKVKRKGMDYNADIPFEKKAAAGFYDTSDEQARVTSAPVGQTLRRLENKRKPDQEDEERKKRQRKAAEAKGEGSESQQHQTKFIAARDAQIQKLKEAESIGNRKKLVLPGAQVGERELEEIVKIGQANESMKGLVEGGSDAAGNLLNEYDGLQGARAARTPRTAPQEDNVLTEARNLRNMMIAQTPLMGEENTPLHTGPAGSGFQSATPRHQVAFTPNPLLTPLHQQQKDVSATTRDGSVADRTPMRTPMHDGLSINLADEHSVNGRSHTSRNKSVSSLKAGFETLPKPENNFELLVPEDDEAMEETGTGKVAVEDAAEIDARLKRELEEQERKKLARRSLPVQRDLPRPPEVELEKLIEGLDLNSSAEASQQSSVAHLINLELAQLLQHDSIVHPLVGTSRPGGSASAYVHPDDDDIAWAKVEINAEIAKTLGFPNATPDQVREGIAATLKSEESLAETSSWAQRKTQLVYDAGSRRWVDPSSLSFDERVSGYTATLEARRELMTRDASRAAKIEKKLNVTLGGYQNRSKDLIKRLTNAFEEMQKSRVEYESFSKLVAGESVGGPRRVESLKEEVQKLEKRERRLQERYKELDTEKREAEERVGLLEEKAMEEAEALNEAALADMED